MANLRRIGILTGGGDVPGLNVAIKAVTMRGRDHSIEVLGLRRGWASVLAIDPDDPASVTEWAVPLDAERVRTYDRSGGTALHTSRTNPSKVKPDAVPPAVRDDERRENEDGTIDCTAHALRVIDALGLDAIVPVGGEDTLSFADRLHHENVSVVAIPKTMDNDVFGTDYCIGFSTAVTRSVDLITNFRTSVGSHERIGVVELFGRHSGETSLYAAYLADVDRAIIPEVPFDATKLGRLLVEDRAHNPSDYAIMTISEGAIPQGGGVMESGEADAFGHRKLGGIGDATAKAIKRYTGVEIMFQQLGYVIRSGQPDSLDRMVARSYGILAADEVARGRSGRLVALQGGIYTSVPLDIVSGGQRLLDVDALYDVANYRPKVREMMGKPMFLY
ncbi:MAG TPA: 6-phosphofructokinase [Thermoleophilia bacterium]|nr:6-phosphofructokinase [Thermoleophilia bacterium]